MPRPSKFCPNTAAAIVAAVHFGSTVEAACRRANVKRTTFIGWSQKKGFSAILDRAKATGRAANSKRAGDKQVVGAGVEVRQITAAQPPEPAQPVPPAATREYPEIRGACVWSANDAALAVVVGIIGNAMDSLRADLRSRGLNV